MAQPRVLKDKKCKTCQKLFRPKDSLSKYCSFDCAVKNRPQRGVLSKCEVCKKDFYVRPGGIGKIRYCSMKCANVGKSTAITRKCKKCGKEFKRTKSQEYWRGKGVYCSVKCRGNGKSKDTLGSVDKLWSILVKLNAGGKCEYCGKYEGLNSHHIFSRSNRATRWDEQNGVCLCVSHHVFGTFSAHKAPIEFAEWLKEKRGEQWYEALRIRARKALVQKSDYAEIRADLQSKIDKLEGR